MGPVNAAGAGFVHRGMIDHAALLEFVRERSAGTPERLPCHWIGGTGDVKRFPYDGATDFCRECAEAAIAEFYEEHPDQRGDEDDEPTLFLDGGWNTEHDSPPYCEVCGDALDGSLTEYAVDQELEHFEEHPADLDYPGEWAVLANALENLDDDDERWAWISEQVAEAQAELARRAAHEADLAAAPGMTDARAGLVSVLAARATSQANKPSFRLWDWLSELHGATAAERETPRWTARLRRMYDEAERFLANFGYYRGGWDCFKAPYGTYTWRFIVEIEQHNLWATPAFIAGRDAPHTRCVERVTRANRRRHPRGHRRPLFVTRCVVVEHPEARDANPYPEGSEDHRAWDCGYIYATKDRS